MTVANDRADVTCSTGYLTSNVLAPSTTHDSHILGPLLGIPIGEANSHRVKRPYGLSVLENRSISSARTQVLESSP